MTFYQPTEASLKETTESKLEQVQMPLEIPGAKINYATTTITTENVIPHKRIKKRPNYALMNDDAEDALSRGHKSDITIPDVAPRGKRKRTDDLQEQQEERGDEFTPKHIGRRTARLKQQTPGPGKYNIQ